MEILLFTKPDCKKCEYVKGKIPNNLSVKILDSTTVDGMAEAAFYGLIDKNVPILVVDGEIFEGAIQIKNKLTELNEKTKK